MAQVIIPTGLLKLNTQLKRSVIESIGDCTDNLLYIAQQRSPYSGGTLEKSGTSKVDNASTGVTGIVSFKAMNGGFNYAEKMDSDRYNLGTRSLSKSSGGVKSKFSSQTLRVGSGFLTDTATKCEKGYKEYIESNLAKEIKRLGL